MRPRCDRCETYFDNSTGSIVNGESWCGVCLEQCWDCELDLQPGDVESNDYGSYHKNLCETCATERQNAVEYTTQMLLAYKELKTYRHNSTFAQKFPAAYLQELIKEINFIGEHYGIKETTQTKEPTK